MSRPSVPVKAGFVAAAVISVLALSAFQAAPGEYRSPSDGIKLMKYENGRLSLQATDASLDKILSELSRLAMITIVADGPIKGRVSLYMDRLPLEKALQKILRGKDTSFVYTADARTSPGQYKITEVRIYVAGVEKGRPHRYSYSRKRNLTKRGAGSSGARGGSPRAAGMAMSKETKRFISEMLHENPEEWEKIRARFRKGSPEAEEQIKLLLESLDDVKARAGESGASIPPVEGLDEVQDMMKQLLRPRKASPGQADE